jgi:hypothetical protein
MTEPGRGWVSTVLGSLNCRTLQEQGYGVTSREIGSFEKGSLLTQRFEVLLWESTDEYWRWDGAMPRIVLPGSTPVTAGGTGKGKWIDVTDATLRSNLGSNELPGLSLVALAVSGNLSHAITGVYVDAFEADPTGGTDSTDAVIRAAKTLATMTTSGYDKNNKNYNVVIFGPGTYIVGDVPMFTGIRYVGQGPYAAKFSQQRDAHMHLLRSGRRMLTRVHHQLIGCFTLVLLICQSAVAIRLLTPGRLITRLQHSMPEDLRKKRVIYDF